VLGLQSCELHDVAGAAFHIPPGVPPLESLESVWGTEGGGQDSETLVGPDWQARGERHGPEKG
jgi:hypothetical protein